MKTIKLTVFGLLAALLAAPAAAQDRSVYLGLSGGMSQYKESCEGLATTCDDTDAAWRAFAGYRFSKNWSVEFGYADLGESSIPTATASVKTFDLSALLAYPVTRALSVYGRLGAYRARADFPRGGESNTGFVFGAGLGFDLGFIGVRAEWARYPNVGSGGIGRDDIDVYLLGALVRF